MGTTPWSLVPCGAVSTLADLRASMKSKSVSAISWTEISVRPAVRERIEAGVRSWSANLSLRKQVSVVSSRPVP